MPPATSKFRPRPLIWVGLATAAVGAAPLLLVIAASRIGWLHDPNPNPVGLGILAAVTFWPGLAVALTGAVWSAVDRRRRR